MKCILSWGNQIVALLHYSWNGIFVAHFVPGATAPVANWPSILHAPPKLSCLNFRRRSGPISASVGGGVYRVEIAASESVMGGSQ